MQPIQVTYPVQYGISIYVAPTVSVTSGTVNLTIRYSTSNPVLNSAATSNILWKNSSGYSPGGVRFDYSRNSQLPAGSYSLSVTITRQDGLNLSGSRVYTIDQPTDNIVIGLPYSIYPSIPLAHA